MRLFSLFNRLSDFPGSPYSILKGEYDREGRISRYNHGLEELLLREGLLSSPSLLALFPDSLEPDYPGRMLDNLKNECVTIKSLKIDRKRMSYLCFERINAGKDQILLIAVPFDKTNVLRLLQMYSQFEGYYNSNPDVVIAVDANWKIVDINKAGMLKLGYKEKPLFLSRRREDVFILSEDACRFIQTEIKKGNSITEFEVILKKNSGGFINGFASVFSIQYDPEDIKVLYFHIKDLTLQAEALAGQIQMNMELTELNEELNRAHAAMVSQEKMAALGLLAAGLAHEINNPLGFVFNNITVLMSHFKDLQNFTNRIRQLYITQPGNPEIGEIRSLDERLELDYIFEDITSIAEENNEGVERIKNIINSLKSFSQGSGSRQDSYYNLNKSVEEMLTVARNEYKYKANVVLNLGDVSEVRCSALEINQVLLSLMMNSVESIKRQNRRDMGTITLTTHQDEKNIYFTINDDGEGVPREIWGRIFDPFFTTKQIGTGTGLGLAVALDIIVNRHGGTLRLIPGDSPGARFQFSLPRMNLKGELN